MAAIVEEGEVKIFLEEFHNYRGPGRRRAGFYNPALEIDRDLNVAFCAYAVKKGARKFLDGLAATGIRGIRLAKEIGNIEVEINDYNPKSYELIKKNIELNNVDAIALNENLCVLLQRKRYDYIDIDPYGSPIPFISCLFKALKKRTYLAVTATDTATLCGAYKKACIRKYHSIPLRRMASKEAGLRILIAYIAKQAASFDYGFKPLLSYAWGHFFRVYGIMERGAGKAERSTQNIGWVVWDDGWKLLNFEKIDSKPLAGPMWIGKISEEDVVNAVKEIVEKKEMKRKKELMKLLTFIKEEISLPPLYYETGKVAKDVKARQPKLQKIIDELQKKGYDAGRTHFMLNAVKTNAPYSVIKEIFT